MFGAGWSIFADASVNKVKYGSFSSLRAENCFGPIRPIIKLMRDLTVTYILMRFGGDWIIFVDSRV